MYPTIPKLYKLKEDVPFLEKFDRNFKHKDVSFV